MRIISLQAENFKRLVAVDITPDGAIVEITGENGEGKSSTLDAIWAALGGKDAAPAKPIHTGAEKAEVRLVLGEGDVPKLKVTRKFRLKEGVPFATDLIVESTEGARFTSPQAVLDALVGELCFDPLAFTRLKDEEQMRALRRFVPSVDFEKMEGLNRRDYELRTEVNRRVRDLKGQLAALPTIAGDLPEPVDLAALEQRLGEAATVNSEIERRKGARQAAEDRAQAHADRAKGLREQAAAFIAQAEEQEGLHAGLRQQIDTATPLPSPVDTEAVREALAEGRRANDLIAQNTQRKNLEDKITAGAEEEVTLTNAIETRKAEAEEAVRNAEMPLVGLGFGEDFVTLKGEPLAQASMAEKIRISVAIAAAMNPKLRVARIADGSLLDRNSWAALSEYATRHDLQIWVETVEQKGASAVVISEGQSAAPKPGETAVGQVGDIL